MEQLGRYPLSTVLSYLTETEGTSFLITRKRYAHHFLPIFRVKTNDCFRSLVVANHQPDSCQAPPSALHKKHRHRFAVVPVQDSVVLLARLNTRRLFRRRITRSNRRNSLQEQQLLPQGLTTVELAAREWNEQSYNQPPELELLRFLGQTQNQNGPNQFGGGVTLLVSYPRSGNTLVRSLLERTTGIVTGSDTRPDRSLSRELAERHNLVGEGVSLQSMVALVKSHFPERTGNRIFKTKRAILVVRNPYDAIDSYWNMNATKSHTKSVARAVYERFQEKFEALVKNEICVWIKFHDYWLRKQNQQRRIPVLIVRFEDLIHSTEKELIRILKFAIGTTPTSSPLSPFWMRRVKHAVSNPIDRLGSYRPRTASNGANSIGKSLRKGHYSDSLLKYIETKAASHPVNYLHKFGYSISGQGFPANFVSQEQPRVDDASGMPAASKTMGGNVRSSIHINRIGDKTELSRPIDCPFGRGMTSWRHSVTKNDSEPLPIE